MKLYIRCMWLVNLMLIVGLYLGSCGVEKTGVARHAVFDMRTTTVEVEAMCIQGEKLWFQFGSGVIVGPRSVLTARHVVNCESERESGDSFKDGFDAPLVKFTTWDQREVALLLDKVSDDPSVDIVRYGLPKLAPDDPGPFPEVEPVAFGEVHWDPMAHQMPRLCMSAGYPSRHILCGTAQEYLPGAVSAAIIGRAGNSGSPVYNGAGEIIGLMVRGIPMGLRMQMFPVYIDTHIAEMIQ